MSSTLLTSIATVDSIVPFFLAHGLLAFALAYTQPSSAKRPFILLLIALCCLASVRSSISRSIPGEIGGEYVIGFIFHASHFLCLVKLSPPHGSTCSGRWAWAINQLFEARWGVSKNLIPAFSKNSRRNRAPSDGRQQHSASLKLSSQEKKIPGSETAIEDDKEARPSPRTLFLHRLWDLLWTVSVISFLKCHKLAVFSDDITSVPDGFLHRLAEVDAREWVIRIYMTLLSIVLPYCTLRAAHSLASCLSIAFGDLPHRWPPLFGNIEDAYTVRRFYALFWHHLMRKAFTSHAVFIVNGVCRLPRQSQVSRYLIIIVTFLISAALHIASGIAPVRCNFYPQLRYYASIAGALMLEDAVMWVYKRLLVPVLCPNDPRTMLWRLVGYSWVAFFNVWSISKFIFRSHSCI